MSWSHLPGRRLAIGEVIELGRYLSTFHRSGFSLSQGLAIVEQQATSRRLREMCREVRELILSGWSLSLALGQYRFDLPPVFLGAVVAGEQSGALDATLNQVLAWLSDEAELAQKIRSSLRYPKMLALVILGALLTALFVIVPRFEPLFRQYQDHLPLPTRALVFLRMVAQHHGLDVVIVLAALAVSGSLLLGHPVLRERWAVWRHAWPLLGKMTRDLEIARLSATLSLLHAAGLPILKAIEIAQASADPAFRRELELMKDDIAAGASLREATAARHLFSPLFTQMAAVGESTGTLDAMMQECARHHARAAHDAMQAAIQIIQPAASLVLALVVLWLALGIFLPYWNMFALVGHNG